MRSNNETTKYSIGRRGALSLLMIIAICLAAFALSACEAEESGSAADPGEEHEIQDGAAKKYVDLLTSDKSEYYMTIESEQKTAGSDDVFRDVQTIAQDGAKKFVSSDANQSLQYNLDGYFYYYDIRNKQYYKMKETGNVDEITDAYAPRNGYKKTEEKKFDDKKCQCDIFEKETTEEGMVMVNRTEYYVDEEGELVGVVSEQRNKDSDRLAGRLVMTVTDFKSKVPEGTFDLPDGYTEIKSGQ
ncbi:MAG: hypothetical protein IJ132_03690 [Firmicutes bacterium]|nr:hypothetical protein [Bacillota bacterium]